MSSLLPDLAHRLVTADFAPVELSRRDAAVYERKVADGKIRVVVMVRINSIYIYEWYKSDDRSLVSQTDFHNIDQERQMERIFGMLSI